MVTGLINKNTEVKDTMISRKMKSTWSGFSDFSNCPIGIDFYWKGLQAEKRSPIHGPGKIKSKLKSWLIAPVQTI